MLEINETIGVFLIVTAITSAIVNTKDLEPGLKNAGYRIFSWLFTFIMLVWGFMLLGVITTA